jgi:hypothetical protein
MLANFYQEEKNRENHEDKSKKKKNKKEFHMSSERDIMIMNAFEHKKMKVAAQKYEIST